MPETGTAACIAFHRAWHVLNLLSPPQERNMVSRQIATRVIQALSSALQRGFEKLRVRGQTNRRRVAECRLSRPDMDRHIAGCAEGFLHLCSLRLLSREDPSLGSRVNGIPSSRMGPYDMRVGTALAC